MMLVIIIFSILTVGYFIMISSIIKSDASNPTKIFKIGLCIFGIVLMSILTGNIAGEKRGHIKMYQENPKYKMEVLYNKDMLPVDTVYIKIKN